jgi:periplasmic protein TonB
MVYQPRLTNHMRVFMSGQSRINVAGLLCSCVTQAAILGGLFLPGWSKPPVRPAAERAQAPLVVELLPLESEGERRSGIDKRIAAHPVSRQGVDLKDSPASPVARELRPTLVAARPATAPPTSGDAAPVAAAAAPSAAMLSDYQRRLFEIVARNSRYPAEARRQHLAGVTQLAFRVDRRGNVVDSWIQHGSGSDLLDDAALDALERAQPLPPIPSALPDTLEFVVEIDSSLIQQRAQLGG